MKKLAVAFAALFVIAGITPAQASQPATVVIIDSGFDASQVSNVVEELCIIALPKGCNNGSGFDNSEGAAGPGIITVTNNASAEVSKLERIVKLLKSRGYPAHRIAPYEARLAAAIQAAGSSSTSSVQIQSAYLKDWNHGTQMASIVNQVNPDANLILIRNSRVSSNGIVTPGGEKDFEAALEWVAQNASQYNIVAVSFSRGDHSWAKKSSGSSSEVAKLERIVNLLKSRNYPAYRIAAYEARLEAARAAVKGPECPVSESIQSDIVSLQSLGIATLIAAGNDGDHNYIDYPACISESVAVSTMARYGNADGTANPSNNTNISTKTDFVVIGDFNTVYGPVALSSSAATAAMAAYWAENATGNFATTYNSIVSNGYSTNGHQAVAVDVLN